METTKVEKLRAIAASIRELLPGKHLAEISVCCDSIIVCYSEPQTYAEATEWLRSWGVDKRQKEILPIANGVYYTRVSAEEDGITLNTFPKDLPPSCKKVEYVDRVRQTETVVKDGFIEIKRTKIVCGGEAS